MADRDPFELRDDDGDPDFVCNDCIGEAVLSAEIAARGQQQACMGCGRDTDTAIPIAGLARRIAPVYEAMVGFGELEPDFEDDSDRVRWVHSGSTPSELIAEMIEAADDRIAQAIVAHLSGANAYAVGRDGETDWYDDTSETYVIEVPDDPIYRRTWEAFCASVKHERRFFSDTARSVLEEILGPLLDGAIWPGAVRSIGPQDDDRFLFRGRQANDQAARQTIYAAPIAELSAPPPQLATAGRMNPAGISVFYASREAETCVAELRVPVGGVAVVGKFEIIRPLRLLDLTGLVGAHNGLSYFHPNYFERHHYVSFIRGFHNEIKKAVIPGRESLDYLPTQVIAEFLATRPEGPVDGIIFGSAQVSGPNSNVVLFNHACGVVEAEAEVRRDVLRASMYLGPPDEEPDYDEHVALRPLPEKPAAVEAPPELDLLSSFWSSIEEPLGGPKYEPTLRYVPDALQHVMVRAIHYDFDSGRVHYHEETNNAPF